MGGVKMSRGTRGFATTLGRIGADMSAHTVWQRSRVADSDRVSNGIGLADVKSASRRIGGMAICTPVKCLRLGELRAATAAGVVPTAAIFPEVGDILRGVAPGRVSDADITVCDLAGTAVQDTVIADLALRRGQAAKVGAAIDTKGTS